MCGSVSVSDHPSIIRLMATMDFPLYGSQATSSHTKLFPYYKPLLAGFVGQSGQHDTALMQWGWQREWDTGKRLFNSRRVNKKGQSIWQSPVWGESARKHRCLIPVNAFYEWDENQPRGKRDRYRIGAHEAAFTLGGIYEISQDGEMFLSVCTTEPNTLMAEIHHRMPVIIDKSDAQQWLYSDDIDDIDNLMQAKPNEYIVMEKETEVGKTHNLF